MNPINFGPQGVSKNEKNNSVSRTDGRPSGVPRSDKDFSKVLAKNKNNENDEASEEVGEKEVAELEVPFLSTMKKRPEAHLRNTYGDSDRGSRGSGSLFDLSSTSAKEAAPKFEDHPIVKQNHLKESSSIASKFHEKGDLDGAIEVGNNSKVNLKPVDAEERASIETSADAFARLASTKQDSKENSGGFANQDQSGRFATASNDLSYVNPSNINPLAAATNPINVSNATPEAKVIPPSHLQEIVNQLVEKANQMQFDGKTDTTITLKNPPLLAGSTLVVTSFDSAKGEFNISFENLTQAAKNLLDMQVNKDSLMHALETKGYTVHMLTTTTISERLVIDTPLPSGSKQEEERNQQHSGQQQNKKKQQEQEETA